MSCGVEKKVLGEEWFPGYQVQYMRVISERCSLTAAVNALFLMEQFMRVDIIWPIGASYEGDFSWGYLPGFGTFTEPDDSVYKDSRILNTWHEIGEQKYPNSDVYEGSWKEDMFEVSGTHVWSNGGKLENCVVEVL